MTTSPDDVPFFDWGTAQVDTATTTCEQCGALRAAMESAGPGFTNSMNEIARLRTENAKLVALVREAEFCDNSGGEYPAECPWCEPTELDEYGYCVVLKHSIDCPAKPYFRGEL